MPLLGIVRVSCKSGNHGVRPATPNVLDNCVQGSVIPKIAAADMMEKSDFFLSALHAYPVELIWLRKLRCRRRR
jgi:hypothetical protein